VKPSAGWTTYGTCRAAIFILLGRRDRHEGSSRNNYVVMNLFVTAPYGPRLQRPPLPRPPDRQRHPRSLYVDEKRPAVWAEGGARELFALITRQDVFREAELLRRNLLIFQFLEMILCNKNSTLNQACKVAVNPCSITC